MLFGPIEIGNILCSVYSLDGRWLATGGWDGSICLWDAQHKYQLTAVLSNLSLNIASAHIATFGEKAADVFYVTDFAGEKITSPNKQEAIRRAVLKIFEPTKEPFATAQYGS